MGARARDGDSQWYPFWISRLVFPFRYGRLAAGMLIFAVMWLLLELGSRNGEIGFYAKLFFAGMCSYLVPVFSRIVRRSVATFDRIAATLDASSESAITGAAASLTVRCPGSLPFPRSP
ncbi:MAG: hypothetical protein R3E50_17240 [Halioglobus sp.]